MEAPVLDVRGLSTVFFTRNGLIRAVDDLSFSVNRGEVLAIVGESGCGKSISALSIMRLVPSPPGRIVGGEVRLDGRDLLALDEAAMRDVRGNKISMIFQEPMTSLNPVMTVGAQIAETLTIHQGITGKAAFERAIEMLRLVRIPEPAQRARAYPHQLSGGMRQRAMIAMAVACQPQLLIADEPTTALDVTIQAQILDLLLRMREELGTAVILITHDLGVVAQYCDDVAVLFAGQVMEQGRVADIFARPAHPYTRALLQSVPERLVLGSGKVLGGPPPNLYSLPTGCIYRERCGRAAAVCATLPPLIATDGGEARCHFAGAA